MNLVYMLDKCTKFIISPEVDGIFDWAKKKLIGVTRKRSTFLI